MNQEQENLTEAESEKAKIESPEIITEEKKKSRLPIFIVGGLLLTAAIVGGIYWLNLRQYETTDDAFIEGTVVQVSPKLSAYVKKVYVKENQLVKKGDLLVELDDRDFAARKAQTQAQMSVAQAQRDSAKASVDLVRQTTKAGVTQATSNVRTAQNNVEQTRGSAESKRTTIDQANSQLQTAQANLAQNQAQVSTAQTAVAQAEAQIPSAEANLELTRGDFERYQNLYQKGDVSKQRLDQASNALKNANAQIEVFRKQIASANAQLNVARKQVAVSQAKIGEAISNVKTAEQNYQQSLSQIDLTKSQVDESAGRLQDANAAPERIAVNESQIGAADAQIKQAEAALGQNELELSYTKIYAPEDGFVTRKNVQEGQLVQPGQALMAISQKEIWVVANFKETQLESMKPGQAVEIRVDAFSGKTFRGKIDSFQAGTGSRFSVLPPENATGSFVKVVQRIPVKIVFDDQPEEVEKLVPGMSVQPRVKVR